MMIDRERLIAEAADAIWDAHESGLSRGYLAEARPHYSDSEVYARAALAVFEKALGEATVTTTTPRFVAEDGLRTWVSERPTNVERAEMVRIYERCWESWNLEALPRVAGHDTFSAYLASELARAGFRRSEVPEPSAEEEYGEYELEELDESGYFETQGEPSDAHKIIPWSPTGRIDSPVSCQACGRSLFIGHSGDWEHVPQRTATAQSEPSDAQVEAAWAVIERDGLTVLKRSHVRAALRAASEAGGEGR